MATKQGYIRGAAQEVFRRQPKAKGLYKQGGIDRIESERPDKFRGRTRFVLWMFFLLGCACFVLVVPGLFAGTVLIPEIALLVHLLAVAWFSARQMEESPKGIVRHFFLEGLEAWSWAGALLLVIFSMEIRLLAEGLPATWSITEGLQELVVWAFPVAAFVGYIAAFVLGRHYVGFRNQTYEAMMTFEEILKSLQQPMTAQLHKSMRFRPNEVRIKKVPINLASRYNDIELVMTQGRRDDWMLDPVNSSPKQIIWIPITEEWAERRKLLRESHYTVVKEYEGAVSYEEVVRKPLVLPDGAVSPEASTPMEPQAAQIYEGVTSAKDLEKIQRWAETRGKTVIGYDLGLFNSEKEQYENLVFLQRVTPEEASILRRLSELLKVNPWDMWMEFHWITNDEDDRDVHPQRIDTVVAKRSPVAGLSPEAREKFWLSAIAAMPKGSNGWTIKDDQASGIVILRYGKPRTLPELVPMRQLLPASLAPEDWSNLALGIDEFGEPTCIDLRSGPHMLAIGPTGSGKTIGIRQLAVSALARGHDVILIDQVKGGADFATFKAWFKHLSVDFTDASATMLRVYGEVARRKQILIREQVGFWEKVSPDVRAQEKIKPLTVIIDEFASLILPIVIPNGMDKNSEEYLEADEINSAKSTILYYAGKLAREARFVGVHLAIAIQRPDAAIISGELRSNLTSVMLLVKPKSLPAPETLRMGFPGTSDQAADTVEALDNGSPGLALVGADGGKVAGLKVGFMDEKEIPELLREIGVPTPEQWGDDPAVEPERPVPSLPSSTKPSEEALDELTKLLRE